MTMPSEEIRAITYTREFLFSLTDAKKTRRVPKAVRDAAWRLLRHYPFPYQVRAVYEKAGLDLWPLDDKFYKED